MARHGMAGFSDDSFRTLAARVEVDRLLAEDPDCPVFGLNLACAWPFAGVAGEAYSRFSRALDPIRSWAYVYPPEQTHITLVTFLNFLRHRRPTAEWLREVEVRVLDVRRKLDCLLRTGSVSGGKRTGVDQGGFFQAFVLDEPEFCLAPKAGFLRFRDAAGRMAQIRDAVRAWLSEDREVGEWCEAGGLNIPGIAHSTCVRFIGRPPTECERGCERESELLESARQAVNEACELAPLVRVDVDELLLTTETKPYMRGGACLARWKLGAGPRALGG